MTYHTIHSKPDAHIQHTWTLFGIALRKDSKETKSILTMDRIPVSQHDISLFIVKEKGSRAYNETSKTHNLLDLSANDSGMIYAIINSKNDVTTYRTHHWSLECIIPAKEKKSFLSFWRKQKIHPVSYFVVIRGEDGPFLTSGPSGPRMGNPPPPPPGWNLPITVRHPGRMLVNQFSTKKKLAKIELTQNECEVVINDFLASFTTLYDEVAVEERGAVLRGVQPSSDYDSDNSDLCSLVDD